MKGGVESKIQILKSRVQSGGVTEKVNSNTIFSGPWMNALMKDIDPTFRSTLIEMAAILSYTIR